MNLEFYTFLSTTKKMVEFVDGPIWAEPFSPRPVRVVIPRSRSPPVVLSFVEAPDDAQSLAELCGRSFSGPLLKSEEVGLFCMDADTLYEMEHIPLSEPELNVVACLGVIDVPMRLGHEHAQLSSIIGGVELHPHFP